MPNGGGGGGALQRRYGGGAATASDAGPVLRELWQFLQPVGHFRERGGHHLRELQPLPELRRRGERPQLGAVVVQHAERGAGRIHARLQPVLLPHHPLRSPVDQAVSISCADYGTN